MSKRKQLLLLIIIVAVDVYLVFLKFNLKLPHYTLPVVSNSYFTLGDAVAALALVFAVTQLANDSWGLTLRIKGKLKSNIVWILLGLGLATSLTSALLSQPSSTAINVYKNPLFWQIIAFLCFASAPFVLRRIGTNRRRLFNKSTAARYYQVLLAAYSTGDNKQIKAATDIILESLDSVAECIKPGRFKVTLRMRFLSVINKNKLGQKYVLWLNKRRFAKEERKRKDRKSATPEQYAYRLFDTALTDTAVSSYIATKRIDFIWNFTRSITGKRLAGRPLSRGFNSIVSQLFTNENSYLYRQSKYKGTGQFAPVNDLIFGSKYLAQNFEPIRTWREGRSGTNVKPEDYVEVFLRALESSIKNDAFNDGRVAASVGFIMYELAEYTRTLLYSSEDALNEHHMAFWRIEQFFSSTFLELYSEAIKNNKVSDNEKAATKGTRYQQKSLTANYAECFVDFLGELTRSPKDGMSMHQLVVFALDNLYEKEEYKAIRDVFAEYAWEAIDKSVKQGFYPAFIKVYIRLGYFMNRSKNAWIKQERAKLMKLVEGDLKTKIKAKTKMNNKRDYMEDYLLPSELKYNKKKDKFEWTDAGDNTSDFK